MNMIKRVNGDWFTYVERPRWAVGKDKVGNKLGSNYGRTQILKGIV